MEETGVQQRVGQGAQLGRHLRDVQVRGNVSQPNAQHLLVFEAAHDLQPLLVQGRARQPPTELRGDELRGLMRVFRLGLHQDVQELRVSDEVAA